RGLGTVQVRAGRMGSGDPGRVRAQRRLRSAQRAAERVRGRQEGLPRQGDLALPPRSGHRVGGPDRRIHRLVERAAPRFHPEDQAAPGTPDVRHRHARDPGLAPAESPPSALQQQEGAPGVAAHHGPDDYLHLAIEQPEYYQPCHSVFACRGPYATAAGAEAMMKHDIDRARQLVKESGQEGRTVVVFNPTDRPNISRAAVVTQRRLESIGFKVELRDMDWSTQLELRASKAQPNQGGWNLVLTWFTGADVINPAVHFGISGAGPNAWFGWPDVPQLEKLTLDWVRATDLRKRHQLAEQIQKIALDEVTYVPWGEWVQPTAFRKNVQGILPFTAPLFWNVTVK